MIDENPIPPPAPPEPPVQTPGQRRCSVCGTVTAVELCPVDGSKMADMEAVTDV